MLFWPDLAAEVGAGHVMRSMALGEAVLGRGYRAVFGCNFQGFDWVRHALSTRGIETVDVGADQDVLSLARYVGACAAVIDSYRLPESSYQVVRTAGIPLMAMVDNKLRGSQGDLLLDQNIGAEADWETVEIPGGGRVLAGLRYALVRREIRRRRPVLPPTARAVSRPRVLAFFGGSDARGMGPAVASLLASTRRDFDATVITNCRLVDDAASVQLSDGQLLKVLTPVNDLSERVRNSDLVIAAAGSSSWELAALGAAAAVVPVADNQIVSSQRMIAAGAFAGLGSPDEVLQRVPSVVANLNDLLGNAARRQTLHDASWALVDGLGSERAAAEFLSLVGSAE